QVRRRAQGKGREDAMEGAVRTREPAPVPRGEFESSRDRAQLGGPCHERRRPVETAGVAPQHTTPGLLRNPPVTAADKEQSLPRLERCNIQDEQVQIAPQAGVRVDPREGLFHAWAELQQPCPSPPVTDPEL